MLAGLSNSLTEQLKQILEVVGTGLVGVSSSHRKAVQHKIDEQTRAEEKQAAEESRRERIRRGTWHDGRIDCIAGNGVMSELGFGDELMGDDDMEATPKDALKRFGDDNTREREAASKKQAGEDRERKQRSVEDGQTVGSLPIVVIRNFAAKGGASREELLSVLATWAATLIENQVSTDIYHAFQLSI